MSNRRRTTRTPPRYASGAPRRPVGAATGLRLPATWPLAALAVAVELGHLVAAYLEWPGTAAVGVYHVVVGALLGTVAALLLMGTATRPVRIGGAVVAASGPVLWLVGVLVDLPPYREFPPVAGLGVAAGEAVLAALLLTTAWRSES